MERSPSCFDCVVKTGAFIGALMSVILLGFSMVVLISSTHYYDTVINDTSTTTDAPQEPSNAIVLPTEDLNLISTTTVPSENATDQALFPSGNNTSEETTTETTSKSLSTSETIEENVSTSTPPPPSSSSQPPVIFVSSTSNMSLYTYAVEENDNYNNSHTSLLSSSTNSNEAAEKPWNSFFEHQQDLWKDKTDTYRILMQSSSGTGIFAALLQLTFSWLLLCGSGKNLSDRTTLWNLSNFIVLILSTAILLVTFSYNSSTDSFNRSSVFWRDLKRTLQNSSETLELMWRNIGIFLTKNFLLYYYVMGINSIILLLFLVPPLIACLCFPCKKCCCKKKYDEKTESDLMLFETGGDPFNYYS